ncbi:hypothetical protein QTP88_030057 [Uroleucon formosanum]
MLSQSLRVLSVRDQASICPFALREVSVLAELALGHLRYFLTDVPPQSNSPPGDSRIPLVRASSELTVTWRSIRLRGRRRGGRTARRTAGRDATSDRSSVVPRSADGDGPATASRLPVRRPGARATAGVSPAPPTLLRRPEPDPPRSSEPILIPKLRIGFADFPYLHYSMRLEAAHLGDLLRISVRTDAKTPRGPLSNFQGPRGGHGHRRNERCSSRSRPYRPARGFQGRTTLTEKRELFPDPPAASSSSFRLPGRDKRARTLGSGSASGSGIRTGFPLAPWAIRKRLRPWYEDLSPGLGSTDSWTTAVHKKPFSTAAPEGPSRVFATTTKICTDGGSRRSRDLPFDAHRRAILLVGACRDRPPRATAGPTVPPTAEYRHDAPAPSIFRASCFGSNQRLSWSLNTRRFRRLNSAFGSSRSASSAYQKWPTKRLGFRRRLRTRFTRCTSYPEGNFGWNQLLDGSISLSPLYPAQTIDLHVRIAADLHQGCAPGRPKPTWRRRPRTADQRDFERRWVRSLGHRPHRKRFTFIAPNVVFLLFNFPSRYLSTIGLVAVFSLRWSLPPASGCTLKQPDSKARSDPGTL